MKPRHLTPAQLQCILDCQPKNDLYVRDEDVSIKTALKEAIAMILCLWLLVIFAGFFQ